MRAARIAAIFVAFSFCLAQGASDVAPRTLNVIVTDRSVRLDGVELRSGPRAGSTHYLSLDAAKRVLGPPQDTYLAGLGVTVFAWTDVGIHLQQGFRGSDEGKLFKFQVWLEDVADQEHKQSGKFRGRIRVEGVDISPGSTLDSVRPALKRAGFQITSHPNVIEAAKGQVRIFTIDTTNKLERIEAWCP
jgi:hypothetical protein